MNKVVIIVLVLIVVVFVIFVTRGSLTKDQPKKGNKAEAAKYDPPNWTKSIKNVFAAVGKKVKLDCPPNAPQNKDFECTALPLNTDINIPAADASFRVVTLARIKGTAKIEYDDNSPKAEDYELDEQNPKLPDTEKEDDRDVTSIVILEKGGRLRISCQDSNPCQVAQQ
ncbi:MAG TPA: hypothetical protein VF721_22705 [Pyrinomonadaceae bacterium]|jgi:hypothetical protein